MIDSSPITDYPRVTIIILNWNGWQDTIECLESLYRITYPSYSVIVVDNGSEDDSIEKLKEYCEGKIEVESKFFEFSQENKPIKIIEYTREEAEAGGGKEKEIENLSSNRKLILIKNEKNYGFAEGNNIAMRYALKALNPDYVLLLNNDTIVDKKFLGELVKVAESDEKIGATEPLIYYYDPPNEVQLSGGGKINFSRGLCIEKKGNIQQIKKVECLAGACFLIKKELIEKIGMLDPELFLYWEEADLSMRIYNTRYIIIYTPHAKIWHKRGATTKKVSEVSLYYNTRNRFHFMRKYGNKLQILSFILSFFLVDLMLIIASILIRRKNLSLIRVLFKAIFDGLTSRI